MRSRPPRLPSLVYGVLVLAPFSLAALSSCKSKPSTAPDAGRVSVAPALPALTAPPSVPATSDDGGVDVPCIPDFRAHVLVRPMGFFGGRAFAFLSEGHYTADSFSDASIAVVHDGRTGRSRCFLLGLGELDPDEDRRRLTALPDRAAFDAVGTKEGFVETDGARVGPDGAIVEVETDLSRVSGVLGDDGYDYVCRGLGTRPDAEIEESPEAPPCGAKLSFVVRRGGHEVARTPARDAGNLGDATVHWSADGRYAAIVWTGEDRSTADGAFVFVSVLDTRASKATGASSRRRAATAGGR